jgi:hypothetical protein
MLVCLLRSVNGYALRGEAELVEIGRWTYVKNLMLYREHDGCFVGNLPHQYFTESVRKVLVKRGFIRSPSGYRVLTELYEGNGDFL